MQVNKDFKQLDPEELLLLLIVLPAERCVHLLMQLAVLDDEQRMTSVLKRLVEWEDTRKEPLKQLFELPMGLNLLDYMFGEQYLPDIATSGDMYWSYMFNGCRKATEIFGELGSTDAKRIASYIQVAEPGLWSRIKEHVFLWDDICRLSDEELSSVLAELPAALSQDEILGAFLSALDPSTCGKLLGNLPHHRKDAVWNCLQNTRCDVWQVTLAPELYQREIRNLVMKQIRAGRIQSPNAAALIH